MESGNRARNLACCAIPAFVLLVLCVPRLPPGICYGDPGDLQACSAVLGIAHPPGYAGYVSLGWLITRVPGVDPAYVVSLGCLAAGIAAAVLGAMMMVRLGLAPQVAAAMGLVIAAHDQVWQNLLTPEVYILTLLFLTGSTYLLVRYAQTGRTGTLWFAALLYGIALANRPPVVFALPFWVMAWRAANFSSRGRLPAMNPVLIEGRSCAKSPTTRAAQALSNVRTVQQDITDRGVHRDPESARTEVRGSPAPGGAHLLRRRCPRRQLPIVVAIGLLPCVYSFVYLWVRDQPDTPCNYIEQYNTEMQELPAANAGPAAKLERVVWQASGAQFRKLMGWPANQLGSRLRLLEDYLKPDRAFFALPLERALAYGTFGAVVVLGLCLVWRREPAAMWVLLGMIVQPVVFVLGYRIYGSATDVMPMVWSGLVVCGVALSVVLPRYAPGRARGVIGWVVLAAACVWTIVDADNRRVSVEGTDATAFVADARLDTLPSGSVICGNWGVSPALWYAQHVLVKRDDIKVINASLDRWSRWMEQLPEHPVYVTSSVSVPHSVRLESAGSLLRLVPVEDPSGTHHGVE